MGFNLHNNMRLILGPPGTGKTTKLMGIVESYLDKCDTRDIAFVTFTKKGAEEGSTRIMEKYPQLSKEDFVGFRTLHSMAYWQLGLQPKQVFNRKHCIELGKKLNLYIGGISFQDEAQSVSALSKGTQMMFIDNFARCCEMTLREAWRASAGMGVQTTWEEQTWFSDRYSVYKQENYLIDFTDMIADYIDKTPSRTKFKYVIVDEAQDLMRIQWHMIKHMAEFADEVVVAGDDDQAIYQWSGADVETFLSLDHVKKEVLEHSYRLPEKIYNYANKISRNITQRFDKEWRPRGAGGMVKEINRLEHAPLDKGQWLVLSRNNAFIKDICDYLARHMYSYWSKDHSLCDEDVLSDIRAWELLRAGGSVPKYKALRIYERMMVGHGFKRGSKALPSIPFGMVDLKTLKTSGGLLRSEVWYKQFGKLEYKQIEYIRGVLRSGEKLGKPRIIVSTIHSVKGGEADNVLLLRDVTPNTARSMVIRKDEEARVFYVGVTRARHNLYIMDGNSKDKYPLPKI